MESMEPDLADSAVMHIILSSIEKKERAAPIQVLIPQTDVRLVSHWSHVPFLMLYKL